MCFDMRTLEGAVAQVELRDIVAKLAEIPRQREALVAIEDYVAALGLRADELERELACDSRVRHTTC